GVPAVQTRFWQVSAPLQTLASAHEVPLVTLVAVQPVAGTQLSVVHGLPSLQVSGVPATQTPAEQVSVPLHRFPSLHSGSVVHAWAPTAPAPSSPRTNSHVPSLRVGRAICARLIVSSPVWAVLSPVCAGGGTGDLWERSRCVLVLGRCCG